MGRKKTYRSKRYPILARDEAGRRILLTRKEHGKARARAKKLGI